MNTNLTSLALVASAAFGAMGCGSDSVGAILPDAGAPEEPPPIECENPPPQLMIVLDRSGSFSRRPDGTLPPNTEQGKSETRWAIMLDAIHKVTTKLQAEVQFGLTLFPYDPNGTDGLDCSNLDTWLTEYLPPESNDLRCQPGEVVVSPSMMNGSVMTNAISRDSTGLCSYTPIGAGLAAAHSELDSIATDEYEQAAILITDGADTCDGDSGYNTDSLATTDAMAAAGIRVYVLGFSGSGDDFDPQHLNDLACAGGTAPDFTANCEFSGGGFRAVAKPTPAELFYVADEIDSLTASLSEIAEDACNVPAIDLKRAELP